MIDRRQVCENFADKFLLSRYIVNQKVRIPKRVGAVLVAVPYLLDYSGRSEYVPCTEARADFSFACRSSVRTVASKHFLLLIFFVIDPTHRCTHSVMHESRKSWIRAALLLASSYVSMFFASAGKSRG